MSRSERVLVWLAVVFLFFAVAMCVYLADLQSTQQSFDLSEGIPVSLLLSQSVQQLAPSFALVGLACGVGVLFVRAVRWQKRPSERESTPPE